MAHPRRPDPAKGVFETLLVLDGRPVELDTHLARLHASLSALFPGREVPPLEVAGEGTGALRITVAPDRGGRLEAKIERRGGFVPLYDTNPPQREISIESLLLRGGLGAHKWADRSLLDGAQAELPEDTLPLVVDTDGAALEASRANLFAARDGALFTPPLDGRILPGITRMRVLELATDAGVDIHEKGLSRDDILAADEVFITGSVRGIERVTALDGAPLGSAGEIGDLLAAELWRTWAGAKVG